jgi:acyl-[acyl-carrier-protein]-phospholipid O-acyltransferase / long-chain-fatty-acid--[acyl-carrier-protein] ligase
MQMPTESPKKEPPPRQRIGVVGLVLGRLSRRILRLLGGAAVRMIYRIKVIDMDRIPKSGGALLLPNHVTFADGFFIAVACPRPVRFVMDDIFMSKLSIRLFAKIFEIVAIRRDQPREAIRIIIDALQNGSLVCLFPEGQLTRTGMLNELRRGFELIARKAGHPLIPLWCDGSWASIFSFERGRFFRKMPYQLPFPMTLAYGEQIPSARASLAAVRDGLHRCSASAIAEAFSSTTWDKKPLHRKGLHETSFASAPMSTRRRLWINGHQIGQINALQRRQPFHVLAGESLPLGLLTFAELFGSAMESESEFQDIESAIWVGGDSLRDKLCGEVVFYDFGTQALTPISQNGVLHLPCLAIDSIVISMSMPHPAVPNADSEYQTGHKLGTWGKLLPGWFLVTGAEGEIQAHGPAAPANGLRLPSGCYLDAEGFLTAAE